MRPLLALLIIASGFVMAGCNFNSTKSADKGPPAPFRGYYKQVHGQVVEPDRGSGGEGGGY